MYIFLGMVTLSFVANILIFNHVFEWLKKIGCPESANVGLATAIAMLCTLGMTLLAVGLNVLE